MSKLITRYLVFLLVGYLLLCLICEGIMTYPKAFNANFFNRWFSTYQVISKSDQTIDSDTLFLGDSVAGQLFRPEHKKNHLAYTAAVLMPGYYMTAAHAIKANPNIKNIILISGPLTIGYDFEQYTTYPYFIKTFYKSENFEHITEGLQAKIDQYRFSRFFQYPIIKLAPFSDIDCSANKDIEQNFALSDLSIEYLRKLKQLCQKNNIKLQIVSGPITDTHFQETNDWKDLRQQIKREQLDPLFRGFFKSIKYLEADKFTDGFHIHTEYISECKKHLLSHLNSSQKLNI